MPIPKKMITNALSPTKPNLQIIRNLFNHTYEEMARAEEYSSTNISDVVSMPFKYAFITSLQTFSLLIHYS